MHGLAPRCPFRAEEVVADAVTNGGHFADLTVEPGLQSRRELSSAWLRLCFGLEPSEEAATPGRLRESTNQPSEATWCIKTGPHRYRQGNHKNIGNSSRIAVSAESPTEFMAVTAYVCPSGQNRP